MDKLPWQMLTDQKASEAKKSLKIFLKINRVKSSEIWY